MKRRDDDQLQPFLVGFEPIVVDEPSPERSPFDPAKLRIIEHEGTPCVLDLDLGQALGYPRPDRVRRLIERLATRKSWGSLRHRDANPSTVGGRPGTDYLLTEKQVVLTCMACKLPDIDEVQSLIADVFIAWRHGRLRAVDAHTEVELQEATDQAFDEMPTMFAMFQQWQANGDQQRAELRAARAASERAERAVMEIANKHRRYPLADTVRVATAVCKHYYRDYCPCCQRVKVCPNADGTTWVPNMVGTQWGHMKGSYRREVLDGWFICEGCNRDYEDSKNTKDIYQAYIAYIGHVEAYLRQGELFV